MKTQKCETKGYGFLFFVFVNFCFLSTHPASDKQIREMNVLVVRFRLQKVTKSENLDQSAKPSFASFAEQISIDHEIHECDVFCDLFPAVLWGDCSDRLVLINIKTPCILKKSKEKCCPVWQVIKQRPLRGWRHPAFGWQW